MSHKMGLVSVSVFSLILMTLVIFQTKYDWQGNRKDTVLVRRIRESINNGDDLDASLKEESFYYSYLHLAALTGDLEAARLLIENKADINVKDKIEATALHRAAQKGEVALAKLLLDHGAKLEARSHSGNTPLGFAVGADKASQIMVLLLLSYGADVNAQDEQGDTALHQAVLYRNNKVAEILIKNGANVNAQGWAKQTPLHSCARYGVPEIAEILLENDADKNIRDSTGQSAYDIAVSNADPDHESVNGKKEVARLLMMFVPGEKGV